MKKAGIIVLLLIGIIAALPWVNGIVMERIVRNGLARMNRNAPASGVRYDLVSYYRGYAGTVAEWKMDLGSMAPLAGTREIFFTERASHGWTAITSETSLEKNEWYARWAADRGRDPLTIRTRYAAFGPVVTKITLDALPLETGKRSLAVGALDLVVTADPSFDHVTAKGNWKGMSEDGRKVLGKVSFDSDMEKVPGAVWQGRSRMVADSFNSDDPALALSNLEFTTDVTADKGAGHMDIAVNIAAEDVSMNGNFPSGWSLGFKIKKMDIRAYQDLQSYYGELARRMAPVLSDPGVPPEEREDLLKNAIRENQFQAVARMEKMLKKGFGLEISPLDVTLPQGRIRGNLSLRLLRDMTLAGFLPVALRPDLALEIFSLDSRLEMPGEFETPNLTAPLFPGMKTGLFVLKDGRLFHQAMTRDGKLYLNDQAVDLDGLPGSGLCPGRLPP